MPDPLRLIQPTTLNRLNLVPFGAVRFVQTLQLRMKAIPWFPGVGIQSLYLLSTAATPHGGIGLLHYLCHCCGSIYNGVNYFYFWHLITDTQVLLKVFLKNTRQFLESTYRCIHHKE